MLLEERKYEPKKIKMESLIDDDLEANNDSNDETESDYDNDESNE